MTSSGGWTREALADFLQYLDTHRVQVITIWTSDAGLLMPEVKPCAWFFDEVWNWAHRPLPAQPAALSDGASNTQLRSLVGMKHDDGTTTGASVTRAGSAKHLRFMTFFSDGDCNATARAAMKGWSNLCISGNLTNLRAAKQAGMLSLIDAQNILMATPGQASQGWAVWSKPDGACLRNESCANHWDGLGKRWKDTVLCILGKPEMMSQPAQICKRDVPKLEMLFLGDELCDGGIPAANLSTVASYVRQLLGPEVSRS